MSTENQTVRLTVDVSPAFDETLDALASRTGGTRSDVLRKGIALMVLAVEAKERDGRLGIVDVERRVRAEIVGV